MLLGGLYCLQEQPLLPGWPNKWHEQQSLSVKRQLWQMGATQQSSKMKVLNPNSYFLSMTALPEDNKLLVEAQTMSMTIVNRWSADLDKLNQTHPQSLLLPRHYRIVERSVCGQTLKLELQYDCYHIFLSDELSKRAPVEKYLEETQIWYLVYTLVESAHACHQVGKPVGDIRPKNLLLSKEGKLRVLSRLSLPSREDVYLGSNNVKDRLYSPQQLQKMKKGYKQFHLDYVPSESFAIGMTILSVGTLQDMSKCYNYDQWELNKLQFNRVQTFWHQNQFYSELLQKQTQYSKQLKNIVLNLLETQPKRRMTSIDLYDLLLPHRQAIMLLKPFQLDLSKNSSPKKRSLPKSIGHQQGIHKLHSRKSSSKGSPYKQSNLEVSSFLHHLNAEFSFNSPPSFNASHQKTNLESSVPTKKKKINTSYAFMKQSGQQFK